MVSRRSYARVMAAFTGFPPETLAFLAGLNANNSKDWFAAHRSLYDASVPRPETAGFVLGYAALEGDALRRGVAILAAILTQERRTAGTRP